MKIDVLTIFPEYFQPLQLSLLGKAQAEGLAEIGIHNLRDFTTDVHRSVDDTPYGGGPGMVMKVEVLQKAIDSVLPAEILAQTVQSPDQNTPLIKEAGRLGGSSSSLPSTVVKKRQNQGQVPKKSVEILITSAAGRLYSQKTAKTLSELDQLIIVCGRFEGFDQRIVDYYERAGIPIAEISIGNFVTFGGEAPALAIIESVVRLLPGVLGNQASLNQESFAAITTAAPSRTTTTADSTVASIPTVTNTTATSALAATPTPAVTTGTLTPLRGIVAEGKLLVEYPQYTKPAEFAGLSVPEVLLNGNHAEIARYRLEQAKIKTLNNRPDLA
jgi:tRNA (guanine37-N1)-methyltransferase